MPEFYGPNPPLAVTENDKSLYGMLISEEWQMWHTISLYDQLQGSWANFPDQVTFFNVAAQGRSDWRTNLPQAGQCPWPFRAFRCGLHMKLPRLVRKAVIEQVTYWPEYIIGLLAELFSYRNRGQLQIEESDVMDLPMCYAPGGHGMVTPLGSAQQTLQAVAADFNYESMVTAMTNGIAARDNAWSFGNEGKLIKAQATITATFFFDPIWTALVRALHKDTFPKDDFALSMWIRGVRGKQPQ